MPALLRAEDQIFAPQRFLVEERSFDQFRPGERIGPLEHFADFELRHRRGDVQLAVLGFRLASGNATNLATTATSELLMSCASVDCTEPQKGQASACDADMASIDKAAAPKAVTAAMKLPRQRRESSLGWRHG